MTSPTRFRSARDPRASALFVQMAALSRHTLPTAAASAMFALRFERLCIGAQTPRLARAQAELARLHIAELARLCRAAASMRMEHDRGTGPHPQDLAAWRCAFRDELLACAADEVRASPSLRDVLSSCCSSDLSAWASAPTLAEAALHLHPKFAARWTLARALAASGQLDDAIATAALAVRAGLPSRRRRELFEQLECWLRRSGRSAQADLLRRCA